MRLLVGMEWLMYLLCISLVMGEILSIPLSEVNVIDNSKDTKEQDPASSIKNSALNANDNYNEKTTINLLNENNLEFGVNSKNGNKPLVNPQDGIDAEQKLVGVPQSQAADAAIQTVSSQQSGVFKEDAALKSDYSIPNPSQNEHASDEKKVAAQNEAEQRQATQSTQGSGTFTTPGNFVQQFIQNSPLGPFLNQLSGQNNVNDDASGSSPTTSAPAGGIPPAFLNPIQTVVNSTTQAFQGLQQFASSIGNQFQSTLSNFAGQAQQQFLQPTTTTARPNSGGPIQQFVSNFIGGINPGNNLPSAQQQQQASQQQPQGPFQGILNILQGQNTNRPPAGVDPSSTATAAAPEQPAGSPEEPIKAGEDSSDVIAGSDETNVTTDNKDEKEEVNNRRKDDEVGDVTFEENGVGAQEGVIVVNDDEQNDDDFANKNDEQNVNVYGQGRAEQGVSSPQGSKGDGKPSGASSSVNANQGAKTNINKKKKKKHESNDGSAVGQK